MSGIEEQASPELSSDASVQKANGVNVDIDDENKIETATGKRYSEKQRSSEEQASLELSSDASVQKPDDVNVDIDDENKIEMQLSSVSSEDTGSEIPASDDPGCLGAGCYPNFWQQVVILLVCLAVVAAVVIPNAVQHGGFREFSALNYILIVHGCFDLVSLGIPMYIFTEKNMPNYLGGPEVMKKVGFGPDTEAYIVARSLFQYIGAVVIALTTAAIVVGIFGCRYMIRYFMIAWLSIDVLLLPLNLTMIFRWKKFGGAYTQYVLMCCFSVGMPIMYGILFSQDGLWPDTNCCYNSC